MKANELMIGDWVRDNLTQMPLQVNASCIRQFERQEEQGENMSASAISLTEEILETNSLKWSGTWESYCYFCDNRKYIMVTHDEDEGFGIHSTKIRFHYVHELQHALRLCGLTELADNFKVSPN